VKRLFTLVLALLAHVAMAQVPADCAVTYRNDGAWQGQLTTRVGAHYSNPDYTWVVAVPFQLPATPIAGARFVLPTWGSGYYDPLLNPDATGTVNLTVIQSYDSARTCSGFGPGFTYVVPPTLRCVKVNRKQVCTPSTDSVVAATVVTPLITGDLAIDLNAAGLAAIQALQASGRTDVVFGVSMVVPRAEQLVRGELKKTNVPGMAINMDRQSKCEPTLSPYCPRLELR